MENNMNDYNNFWNHWDISNFWLGLNNDGYEKSILKKIPKKKYKIFIQSSIYLNISLNIDGTGFTLDSYFCGYKVFEVLNIINAQIELTGLTSDDFKKAVTDKRKHQIAENNNEENYKIIDMIFEKIDLRRELSEELVVNNIKHEKRVKL
jgi:hypothetical protein